MITAQDLDTRFGYHPPTAPAVANRHEHVRAVVREAAGRIVAATPPGREQSLAVTALEESMMWANAAIARHQAEGAADGPVLP